MDIEIVDTISLSSEDDEKLVPKKILKNHTNEKEIGKLKINQMKNANIISNELPSRSKILDYFPIEDISKAKNSTVTEPIFYYAKKKPVSKNGEKILHPVPTYKIISGTTFAVDAFRFGIIEGISHYFLTHFHADHYIGLNKNFNKPIFLSKITGKLVKKMLNVDEKYLNIVSIRVPFRINDVNIMALDANHCPGALMFVFHLPKFGITILHTGDFRAHAGMESEPIFWNYDITTIYLDTTYLRSEYNFMSQWESIKYAQEYVSNYRKKLNGQTFVIVCGSYLIGKEKVWLNIAEYFHYSVWMDKNRRKVVECIDNSDFSKHLVNNPKEAVIHVLPINKLHYNFLEEYLEGFDIFDNLLAIIPSGWQKKSFKPIVRKNITILGIEYSEHSSYAELMRFVKFIKPKNVISTVPLSGKDLSKTPKIPSQWLEKRVSKSLGYQPSITTYIHSSAVKHKSSIIESNSVLDHISINSDDSKSNKNIHSENSDEIDLLENEFDWML